MREPTLLLALLAFSTACASPPTVVPARSLLVGSSHAEWTRPAPPVSRLRFETSKGAFVVELVRESAPLGVRAIGSDCTHGDSTLSGRSARMFDTHRLDAALDRRTERLESERTAVMERVVEWKLRIGELRPLTAASS